MPLFSQEDHSISFISIVGSDFGYQVFYWYQYMFAEFVSEKLSDH